MDKRYSVLINRPAQAVFNYVTDPMNIPSWAWYIEEVHVYPEGPLQVGSEIHQTVRGRESIWRVTAFEPFERCTYKADYWYAAGVVTYTVEPLGDKARFTIHDRAHRQGYLRVLGPVLDLVDAHYRRVMLKIVKETLEAGRAEQVRSDA